MGRRVRVDSPADAGDVAAGIAVACARAGAGVVRFVFLPVRVVTRAPLVGSVLGRYGESLADEGRAARERGRNQLEATVDGVLASPEAERAVDHALAGPLPEAVARSIVDRQVVHRVAEQVLASTDIEAAVERALEHETTSRVVEGILASPGFERLVVSAVESQLASTLTDRVVESPEMQRLVEEIASSPAVRTALVRQTASLGDEVAAGLRHQTTRLDDGAERTVHRWLHRSERPHSPSSPADYGGLGARGIAFAVDLAIGTAVFLAGAAFVWLVASLVGGLRPSWLAELLSGVGWSISVGAYLVLFWNLAGQTPGMRMMRLRVAGPRGDPPGVGRSLVRLIGLVLAIIPLFAGFLPVLVDERRRALQDFMAGTTVRAEHAPLGVDETATKAAPPVGRPAESSTELPV